MKLFTHIIALHCTSGSQTMINDATPDIARTPHTFIKRIGSPGQHVGCAIYAEKAVANAMVERLSNALHLRTATAAMSLGQTILLNRCINQLFFNQEKVDTSTKLFSECGASSVSCFTGESSVSGIKPETCSQSFGHHTKALALSFWTYSFRWVPNHQEPEKHLEKIH